MEANFDIESSYATRYNVNPSLYESEDVDLIFQNVRIVNCLHRHNVFKLSEFLKLSYKTLANYKNLGYESLRRIEDIIERYFLVDKTLGHKEVSIHTILDNLEIPEEPISITPYEIITEDEEQEITERFEGFLESKNLTQLDQSIIDKLRFSYSLLGSDCVDKCCNQPDIIYAIIEAFTPLINEYDYRTKKAEQLRTLLSKVPEERASNFILGYIRAYNCSNQEQEILLKYCTDPTTTISEFIYNIDILDSKLVLAVEKFIKWVNFDISVDIDRLIKSMYKRDRTRTVVKLRSEKKTLEEVGSVIGVTRERIRQIEAKAARILGAWDSRIKILNRISAELNGETILSPTILEEYFGEYTDEIVYLLKIRQKDTITYNYDDLLDAFIVGNESISEIIINEVDQLPEYFNIKEIPDYIKKIQETCEVPDEVIKKVIDDTYNITGETYHRVRLSLKLVYTNIITKYFPDGIQVYDDGEIDKFKEYVQNDYGIDMSEQTPHAIASIIMRACILCNHGTYKIKQEEYIPEFLAHQLHKYIDYYPNDIVFVSAIYSHFEEELIDYGVDNRYYLFGILHELFEDDYFFKKGYIYKNGNTSTIYMEVVRFVKQSRVPVKKEEIIYHFPGITDIVLTLALTDSSILNYFGEYFYAGYLSVSSSERASIQNTLNKCLSDNESHHRKDIFEVFKRRHSDFLAKNYITFAHRLYSVLEYMYHDQFQFSTPYIAKKGISIGKPGERIREVILSSDEISISDILDFCKENHYTIYSILEFIVSFNETHLLKDQETLIKIDITDITIDIAQKVEEAIIEELITSTSDSISDNSSTKLIIDLECIYKLPKISIPWNEWLIYSILKKWSTRLELGTTYPQFKYAIPIVALSGELDTEVYQGVQSTDRTSIIQVDDLDNIDDLISDYVLEDEELEFDDI